MTNLDAYLQTLQRFGIAPGLERIRALLSRADEPQRDYPVVLIGGTNGKGSTCEFLARHIAESGRRVGLYTSPHLYTWNERIRTFDAPTLAGSDLFPGAITDEELDALLHDALPHIEAVAGEHGQPTEFETLTFLGLWHFARRGVEAAVIEVGLGGTWDATNVTDPTISVLTRVALDHTDRLGNTLEAIARDKADIARHGRPFVTAEENPATLHVLQEECDRRGARLIHIDTANLAPAEFQAKNARLAVGAYHELCQKLGWPNRQSSIINRQSNVPGRFEIVAHDPLIILDGANNPDGAQALADRLKRELVGRDLTLVFGVSADKDWQTMLDMLAPLANRLIVTQAAHPRALPAWALAEAALDTHPDVETIPSVSEAVERARQITRPDGAICITGSFFVLGEVDRRML